MGNAFTRTLGQMWPLYLFLVVLVAFFIFLGIMVG